MKHLVYWAKRTYGIAITVVHTVSATVNVTSGEQVSDDVQYTVPKAVPLSYDLFRVFMSKMQSEKFPYGSLFDRAMNSYLIDKKDLPADYCITCNDKILVGTRVFDILSVADLDWDRVNCIILSGSEVAMEGVMQ